jgi:hypothetical protein
MRMRPLCFGTAGSTSALTRRAAQRGYVAASNPHNAATAALARRPFAPQQCARAFASTPGDDDDDGLNRSLDALGDDFFEQTKVDKEDTARATPAGDLQYAGERPGNWEELLAEAAASYPARAGPRKSKHLKREARRFKVIRRQHYRAKVERMAAHTRNMARRSELAEARRGWDGPRLPCA